MPIPTQLTALFRERFPRLAPRRIAQAPGRLNLIGEHTDYNGLPVLPFSITPRIRIVFSPTDDNCIELYSENLPDQSPVWFALEDTIPPFEGGHWGNYVKAAIQDGIEFAREQGVAARNLRGLKGILFSDVPLNAGLSSSSALVVAVALAFFDAQGWDVGPLEMAVRTARAERYVGTHGGGMDQTTALCGKLGHLLKIYFHPLEVSYIPLNVCCSFVVAHSQVEARKSGEAQIHYNRRVLECRLVTEIINSLLLKPQNGDDRLNYLGDLRFRLAPNRTRTDWKHAVLELLPGEDYTLEDVAALIGSRQRVDEVCAPFSPVLSQLPPALPLRKRAHYLFEEWERVERAVISIRSGDLQTLGELLYQSHEGLQHLYEVSHPRLDELVALAREFGLPGARLVGAGFGGSTLHLVPENAETDYLQFLARRFYHGGDVEALRGRYLHVFHPDAGATVGPLVPDAHAAPSV
jgi:galactokinase